MTEKDTMDNRHPWEIYEEFARSREKLEATHDVAKVSMEKIAFNIQRGWSKQGILNCFHVLDITLDHCNMLNYTPSTKIVINWLFDNDVITAYQKINIERDLLINKHLHNRD